MALNILRLPLLLYCTTALFKMAVANTVGPSSNTNRNEFASDMFRVLTATRYQDNVIYSPASIQSCLTLAFMGADGGTSDELRKGLRIGSGTKESLAQNYADFINKNFKPSQSDGPTLKMANGVFVNQNFEINQQFNKIAEKNFDSKVERLNFVNSEGSVKHINDWVEQQTERKIQNLLTQDSVNQETSAILVNAIYFKGLWETQFSEGSTRPDQFFMANNQKTTVDMMFVDDAFNYVELPELDAKAIELPYQNSDLSLLVILPKNVDGLKELEAKLAGKDLNDITSKMVREDVDVFLPKFKIEFEIDLKEPLQQLGIGGMFENTANFSSLFETKIPQKISDVRHKAFLSVNEAGSEAAAATFLKIIPMSLNLRQKTFKADHPFVFAIRNADAVYFAGHVAKF